MEYWLGQFVNDVSLTRDEKLSRKVINLGWSAYFIVIIHVTGISLSDLRSTWISSKSHDFCKQNDDFFKLR